MSADSCQRTSGHEDRLTLLRCSAQDARERALIPPNALHARIVFLPTLQSRNSVGVFSLHLLYPRDVVLDAPVVTAGRVVAMRSEGLALRIHRSATPSELAVQHATASLGTVCGPVVLLELLSPPRLKSSSPPP